uniref:Uncharacterized protein n=1 Tax=Myotis myotis TaxID=51298 RepID=A0A7J7VZ85_MYOMY|nr:hypothetical protein mMyoMyo1_012363 [Myotis myotis]
MLGALQIDRKPGERGWRNGEEPEEDKPQDPLPRLCTGAAFDLDCAIGTIPCCPLPLPFLLSRSPGKEPVAGQAEILGHMPGAARDGEQGLCPGPFLCWTHLATTARHADAGLTLGKAQLQYHYCTEAFQATLLENATSATVLCNRLIYVLYVSYNGLETV